MKELKCIKYSALSPKWQGVHQKTALKYFLAIVMALMFMTSCGKNEASMSATDAKLNLSGQLHVDYATVGDKRQVKLSDIIDKLDVVKMDNSADALFKRDWVYLSDNYIVAKDGSRDMRPAKIFDKKGRYIAPIGGIGRGPGEYTSVYDILIDENMGAIYLTQFSSRVINQYDLNGKFIKEIELGATLNKPRLFNNGDSTISVVNLSFNDRKNAFVAATFNPFTNEKTILTCQELGTNFENEEGAGVGFNNEVFSYRNCIGNTFNFSYNDNHLLKYDPSNNSISSVLDFSLPENMRQDHWCVYNELPNSILVHIVGPNGKTIEISKNDGSAAEVEYVNDLLGGFETGMLFQDGYYFKMYEPRNLKDGISEFIKSNDVDDDTNATLMQLINSVDDDDNNILLIGKLKP